MPEGEESRRLELLRDGLKEEIREGSREEKGQKEKRKLRLMFIGKIAAGKTSLCQRLNHEELTYHKTQTVQLLAKDVNMIDTPGEYLERRMFRGPLMVTAMNADLIVFVQSALDEQTMFPPNFTTMFPKPCVGVVTKCDAAGEEKIIIAEKYLAYAGIKHSFRVSNVTLEGMPSFMDYLEEFEEELFGADTE